LTDYEAWGRMRGHNQLVREMLRDLDDDDRPHSLPTPAAVLIAGGHRGEAAVAHDVDNADPLSPAVAA
jgi:hypothetical protein